MTTISLVTELRKNISLLKQKQRSISFVPTMGKLHEGHLSLIREAKKRADIVVVSIFVNPTQFGPNEDFSTYPRDLEADLLVCESLDVDIVFTPSTQDIYGNSPYPTEVYIPTLSQLYCGESRKDFFKGICSVVLRLFMIIQPDIAIFGEKDYQQFRLLVQMVEDLFLPITIISVPIYREQNGLAMSSRNAYLTVTEQEEASVIYKALLSAKQRFLEGSQKASYLIQHITDIISENSRIIIDYCVIINHQSLEKQETASKHNRILIAAYLNKTRLIDNIDL